MARNMCYDHTFSETRDTLIAEEIEKDDLTTAMVGTLSNCVLLQGRLVSLAEKYTSLETEVHTLRQQVEKLGTKFGCYLPEEDIKKVHTEKGEYQTDYKDLCIKMYSTLRGFRESITLKTDQFYKHLTDEKLLK